MTTVTATPTVTTNLIAALSEVGIRQPSSISIPIAGPSATLEWTPDLTTQEQATVDALLKLAVGSAIVTKAERDSIEAQLATLRTFQQMSQSEFIALAQNARDRQLFDVTTSLIRVIRVFLRD